MISSIGHSTNHNICLKQVKRPSSYQQFYFKARQSKNDPRAKWGHAIGYCLRLWRAILLRIMIVYGLLSLPVHANETHMAPYNSQASLDQGELILNNDSGQSFLAPLMKTEVDIQISGLTASVVLKQSFSNPSDTWMEGRYQFPLPERAAVHRMVMQVGERRIIGQIKEKTQAKRIYQAAKKAGQRASLVSQQRPNMFSNKVANIGPGETVHVEIHYVETLKYDHGEFSLRFPTTFTPRYIPPTQQEVTVSDQALLDNENNDTPNDPSAKTTVSSSHTELSNSLGVNPDTGWHSISEKTPDYLDIRPPMTKSNQAPPLQLQATIDAGFPLEYIHSLFHPIHYTFEEGQYHVSFQQQSEPMNRDIVLRWKPTLAHRINAAVFKETLNDEDYHLLMLLPHTTTEHHQRLPREVVFVIDTSGSMSGVSIRQAKAALLEGLRRLQPTDRFNIVDFSNHARKLFPDAVTFNAQAMTQATAYIQKLQAQGGTNISNALSLSLGSQVDGAYLRQVIFITDGSVSNEEALFSQIVTEINNSRLFTVGIGSAPNSHFMREAAAMGRGSFTHIGNINDVSSEMADLFSKLENPILSNIEIDFPESKQIEVFPKRVPDLYLNEPLLLYVKSPSSSLEGNLQAKGNLAGEVWQQSLHLHTHKQQAGIAKQWARQKIHALMSPRNPLSAAQRKRGVTEVALQHQLLSRYTSFVAVEQTVARPKEAEMQSHVIPNAMPKGNTMAMPNTATPAMMYCLVGIAALVLLMLQVLSARRFP